MNKNQIAYIIYMQAHNQKKTFQGRGCFLKLGHFDKHFLKNSGKKTMQQKILEPFVLDTLKTIFWMVNLTSGSTKSGPFFQNQGIFFNFRNSEKEGLPLSPYFCTCKWKTFTAE